ncbi:MAG TPA: polymorphic toxin-type HINT domain-containing protein, partial [Polyangia bacterium]
MKQRKPSRSLLRDVRGGTIELIIVIGLFVFAIVMGVRHLAGSTNAALECQGVQILNPDGTRTCGKGPIGNGSNPTALAGQTPPACRGGFCMCFVAGTPVMTATGLQPIEAIPYGTLVLTRGEADQPLVWRPVVNTFVNRARALVTLTVRAQEGRAETLSTTANHPFYVGGRGWVEAGELVPGQDTLIDHAGRELAIESAETLPGRVRVYNLEIAEHHSYFVGTSGVWVHNVSLSEVLQGKPPTLVRVSQWRLGNPVNQNRPIKILDGNGHVIGRTNAQVMRRNADGTFDVQWTQGGFTYHGRADGRGRTHVYPQLGTRLPINHNGQRYDALLIGRNSDDGSHEVEANLGGQRLSGRLPAGSDVVAWYPMPPLGNYVAGTPIAGHVPVQTPTADGNLITTIGNIQIIHPAPHQYDHLQHVRNDRANFVAGVLNDLAMIDSTPSGQALLNSLQNHGGFNAGPVRIMFQPG